MAYRLKTPGLNQSFSCFFQLVFFISSSVGPVYVFHPLHVPLPLSKHLPQVVSKHDHTTSHHSLLPAYLLLPSIPTCHHLLCISLVDQLYTAHLPYHRSFCSSQNSYFIFSQNTTFRFYITQLILHSFYIPFLSSAKKIFFQTVSLNTF